MFLYEIVRNLAVFHEGVECGFYLAALHFSCFMGFRSHFVVFVSIYFSLFGVRFFALFWFSFRFGVYWLLKRIECGDMDVIFGKQKKPSPQLRRWKNETYRVLDG